MRVTRLEIFGFKSFVDRFVLNFDKNMIGIVGPNGCGKSNVVDALRWVLGETYAKHLRGGSFDDLIFNGSDTRRQLGMAEVTLTIRPEQDWKSKIDQEDEEINQIAKIADDIIAEPDNEILDIERDDKIDQAPLDGRLAILKNTADSIPGLFEASEIQFTRRLYRSGESEYFINKSPCRLRDMQELYRLIGLGARGLSIVQQGQIGQFISKKPIERRELLEEAAGISGFRTKMEAASRRLAKTDENLSRLSDIILEVEKQLKTLRRQSTRAKARQSLKEELFIAESELFGIKRHLFDNKVKGLNSQIDLEVAEVQGIKAKIEEKESVSIEIDMFIHDADVRIMNERREKDLLIKNIHADESRLQDLRIKLASIESREVAFKESEAQDKKRLEALEESLLELREKINILESEYKSRTQELDIKKQEFTELETKHALELENFQKNVQGNGDTNLVFSKNDEYLQLARKVEELEYEISQSKEAERALQDSYSELKLKEKSHNELERRLNAYENEIAAIDKQLSSLVKHAIDATDSKLIVENARVFLSALNVPENLEKAVHAVLGEKAQYLISEDSLLKLESYVDQRTKKNRIGVFDNKITQFSQNIINKDLIILGIEPLHAKLTYEASDALLVEEILRDTYVAQDIQTAIKQKGLFKENQIDNYVIVTMSGEVLTHLGWYTLEGEGAEFSFTRRKSELEQESIILKNEIVESKNQLEILENKYNHSRERVNILNQMRQELANNQKQVSSLLRMQSEEEKLYYTQIRKQENDLRMSLREIEHDFLRQISVAEQAQSQAKGSISQIEYHLDKTKLEIDSLTKTILEYPNFYEALNQEKLSFVQSSDELSANLLSIETESRRNRISELDQIIEGFEKERLDQHQKLSEIKLDVQTLRRSLEEVEKSLRANESERDRTVIETEHLCQDYLRMYPETAIDNVIITAGDGVDISSRIDQLSDVSTSIRKRLEREGEVDPQSIELCEIEEKRYETMSYQHKDLTQAKETLEKTIRRLKELSKIRFVNTFEAVNSKFKQLIPRLFSGGSGHLELLNPEDPLQSGVDIVVRPPGKKITTMELMSGGEKALVATAVLVSMFLHHPGPICVLDEIDAPLDDANLVKLLDLIKEIADRTQFLVITHNKITMQSVDRLIGITMQESGVTTAISVTLDEAEKELDKLVANA